MSKVNKSDLDVPDEQFRPERWIYAGIRDWGGRSHCWIVDPDNINERRYWSSMTGSFVVGGHYEASVARLPDKDGRGELILRGTPKYLVERADMELRRQLDAEEAAARVVLAGKAQERKHAADDSVRAALKPLMRTAKRLRTEADRAAFIAYVTAALGRAPYMSNEELED